MAPPTAGASDAQNGVPMIISWVPTHGFIRHAPVWPVFAAALAGCAPTGRDSTYHPSAFAEDALISGVVLENVRACEVDAACYLRIEFADTAVVALYGTGKRPAPACAISVEVSNAAFPVRTGEVVDVVISRCADEGYHLRRLVRVTG